MTKETNPLETVLTKVWPKLDESGKERLLAFGEGMAFMAGRNQSDAAEEKGA